MNEFNDFVEEVGLCEFIAEYSEYFFGLFKGGFCVEEYFKGHVAEEGA